jgi:hypothetical protein
MLVATRFICDAAQREVAVRIARVEVDAVLGQLLGRGHPQRGLGDLHRALIDVQAVEVALEDRAGAPGRIAGEGAPSSSYMSQRSACAASRK